MGGVLTYNKQDAVTIFGYNKRIGSNCTRGRINNNIIGDFPEFLHEITHFIIVKISFGSSARRFTAEDDNIFRVVGKHEFYFI